jgi:thymidylate kinase
MNSISKSPESYFLKFFFGKLSEARVHYSVMRNYTALPDCTGGSDVDLLIPPLEAGITLEILLSCISSAGGVVLGCTRAFAFFKVDAFGCNHEDNSWWGVSVDLFLGYPFKGIDLINMSRVDDFRTTYNSISVLKPGVAAVLSLLKELLHNRRVPQQYRIIAACEVESNWSGLSSMFAPLGEKGLAILQQIILEETEAADTETRAFELRSAFLWNSFQRGPAGYVRDRCRHVWTKVRRYLRPSGIVIAFLGVDGVGKSTAIRAVESVLRAATHNAFEIKHLRPSLLPPLARLKGNVKEEMEPVLDPHASKPSGLIGSLLRLGYYVMDYILGYWLLLRPKIAKGPAIILFDRYCYDMVLDPRRFRISIKEHFIRWFIRLIPQPNVILCMHAAPEVILRRKQELPRGEVERQVKAMRTFALREPRAILVSTEGSVAEVRNNVLMALQQYCANRRK